MYLVNLEKKRTPAANLGMVVCDGFLSTKL